MKNSTFEDNAVNNLIMQKIDEYDQETKEICKLAIELSTQYSEASVVEQLESAIRKNCKRGSL